MNPMKISRREMLAVLGSASLAAVVKASPNRPEDPPGKSQYAERVLSRKPVGYWRLQEKEGKVAHDSSPHKRDGMYHGHPAYHQPGPATGQFAVGFDGKKTYVEIPSHADFSVPTHKQGMTVEAWMQPERLEFPGESKDPYVMWLGKGEKDRQEWAFRFYSDKSPDRPNRLSAYIFNASGGLGAGAYDQKAISPRREKKHEHAWLHVVACYDPGSKDDPKAGVTLYVNGRRVQGPPSKGTLYRSYDIVPQAGSAPLRLGTRDLHSFFIGRLAEVAIYPRVLTAEEIRETHKLGGETDNSRSF
jgi:hypothetical protein